MSRPAVLVVTRIPFWNIGAGERARLLALVSALARHAQVSVLYLKPAAANDLDTLRQLRIPLALHALRPPVDRAAESRALRALCVPGRFDACVFERIQVDHLREEVPPGIRTVLDTHDLESLKSDSRRAAGAAVERAMSFEQELAILARYDRVLLIQEDDLARVAPHLGERAMLAAHPVTFAARPVRPDSRRLGLVASAWIANLHGLDWFADEVWPRLDPARAQVHLYGGASAIWRPGFAAFGRHGVVPDLERAWSGIDVAINPVRWGAGLKIKTVEALAMGLPLVTTSEGARGLRTGAGEAFVVADEPADFAAACRDLLDDPERRRNLGAAAHGFARARLTPQACFGELVAWLEDLAAARRPAHAPPDSGAIRAEGDRR